MVGFIGRDTAWADVASTIFTGGVHATSLDRAVTAARVRNVFDGPCALENDTCDL